MNTQSHKIQVIREALTPYVALVPYPDSIIDEVIEALKSQGKIDNAINSMNTDYFHPASNIVNQFTWSHTETPDKFSEFYGYLVDIENDRKHIVINRWQDIAEHEPETFFSEEGKTCAQWIETLPNPQRAQLSYMLVNNRMRDTQRGYTTRDMVEDYYNMKFNYLSAIKNILELYSSLQGETYWDNFFTKYQHLKRFHTSIVEQREEEERERLRQIERERLEANRLTFSKSFSDMLHRLRDASDVARYLLQVQYHTREFGNYITMRGELASYLPNGREHKTNEETGKWLRDGRQEAKIGKLVKKLISGIEFSEQDYEKFVNLVKSYISVLGDEEGNGRKITFEVVSGADILDAYLFSNYSTITGKDTNLWGSCMRHEECQSYLKLYVNNPEVCSLLVAHDSAGKVLGRALLWIDIQGRKLMDTIYAHENLFPAFKDWAVENGYYYKSRQSCHHESFDMFNHEGVSESGVSVQLKNTKDLGTFPYLDTMKYLTSEHHLTNDEDGAIKKLTCTNGGFEEIEEGVYSEYLDEWIDRDDAIFLDYRRPNGGRISSWVRHEDAVSDYNGDYYLEEDCVEVDGDWYLTNDDAICSDINGDYQLTDNCVYSQSEGAYILNDDAQELHNEDYCLQDHAVKCEFSGEWYHENDMINVDGLDIYADYKADYLETLNEAK